MDPPSYLDASLHPPVVNTVALSISPPPSYDVSLASPATPPPTYGESVTMVSDPYPVLAPPTTATSQQHGNSRHDQQTAYVIHQQTRIRETVQQVPSPTVVVVQPQAVLALGAAPALIRCPHCQHIVNTNIKFVPGVAAWCMCVLFIVVGLICGCCLIPFFVPGMQDVHHSCPQCDTTIHIHKR